ncbi:MAG: histidine kinase, partial [Bacteroidota bacterium]
EQSPKTPELILQLSGLLRYMLYECREDEVTLEKEVDHLQSFVRLNELQIEERGSVELQVKGGFRNWRIAPLILVVFIENAFKHSGASKTEGINIDIELLVSPQGRLHFRCTNNFEPDSNTDNLDHGIGLANVQKRLALIYPEAHQLSINQEADIFEVRLIIDLLKPIQS